MFTKALTVVLTIAISLTYGQNYNVGSSDGGYISEPCMNNDLKCVRQFFAQHSRCTPVYGPVPDPLFSPDIELPVPQANVTFIARHWAAQGMKRFTIRNFYINKQTRNLIFEVEFNKITFSSPYKNGGSLRYHLKGREPIELSDYFYATNRMVSFTMVVPFINDHIDISKGSVYAFIGDSDVSDYEFGPGVVNKDHEISHAYHAFLNGFVTSLKEAYIRSGYYIMSALIENTICKFSH